MVGGGTDRNRGCRYGVCPATVKRRGFHAYQPHDDVRHWRDRAAEMRMLARMMKDIEAIAIMSRLAAGCDLMADRAAERACREGNVSN